MAVAAAPALPTLAAVRPQVVHARPLTARRAHLAPANPTGAKRLHACGKPQQRTSRCAHSTPGRIHMHNTLHTFLPHTYTHDQQQQLGNGNSGSDDSDDSGNDNSVAGSFLQWFTVAAFSHGKAEALAAESSRPCRPFDGCHCRDIRFALDFRQLRRPVVSFSTAVADSSSSCRWVSFMFHVKGASTVSAREAALRSALASLLSGFRGMQPAPYSPCPDMHGPDELLLI